MAKAFLSKQLENVDDRFVSLAKEYTEKLRGLIDILANYYQQMKLEETNRRTGTIDGVKLGYTVDMTRSVLPIAFDLARAMSQHIEHVEVDPLSKMEIRLRLAELEASTKAADRLMMMMFKKDVEKLLWKN